MKTTDQRFTEWRIGYLKDRLDQEQSMLRQIDGWVGVDEALFATAREHQQDMIALIEVLIVKRETELQAL